MVGYGIKDMLGHRNRSALYYGKLLIDVASVRRPTKQEGGRCAAQAKQATGRQIGFVANVFENAHVQSLPPPPPTIKEGRKGDLHAFCDERDAGIKFRSSLGQNMILGLYLAKSHKATFIFLMPL